MKNPLLRAALVASGVVLGLVPAGAASAQTVATPDTTADVWRAVQDPDTGEEVYEPADTQPNVDLTRTVVKHTATRVVVQADYASLSRQGSAFLFVTRVRTNEGLKRELVVENFTRAAGKPHLSRANGGDVRCAGMRHDVDYAADSVAISVPRSCLSKPRWVQGASFAATFTETDFFLDQAHTAGLEERMLWTAQLRRG